MKKLFFILLICCSPIHAQTVAERLDALLNEDLLKTSEVGITVFDLTTGESVYRYQDEKLYRPASTQKIITSVTALACLGEGYTLDTHLSYSGKIENDTLKGNLYLKGSMDPLFMEEQLDSLVMAVVQTGIHYITDKLIADVSMMDSVYWGPGWSWDDAPYAFQPYLSPLMLNGGCVNVTVVPTQKDSLAAVSCSPKSDIYRIRNSAISYQPQMGKLRITRNWTNHDNTLIVSGNVQHKTTSSLSMYPSQEHFLRIFIERLQQQGINIPTTVYSEKAEEADSLYTFFTIRRPMKAVLKEALKESNNLCAESLFFHLARQSSVVAPLTFEDGSKAVKAFMDKVLGFNSSDYRIADGSGISLYNYVSPQLLLEYLKYAYYHRDVFFSFYDALPVAGVDGTLKHRMKNTPAYRNVRAKTGSVTGVSSLAGYVKAKNGHQLAFVIINQNVMKMKQARDFQDKICVILGQ